jgi:hypothetical protein
MQQHQKHQNEFSDLRSLRQVARSLPENISPSTVWRWVKHGIDGIRLKAVSIGSKYYCSEDDLRAFVAAVTAARERAHSTEPLSARSPETEAALRDAGLFEPKRRGRPRKQRPAEPAAR